MLNAELVDAYDRENINKNGDVAPSAPSDNVAADGGKKKKPRTQNVYYVYEDGQLVEQTTNKAAARSRKFSLSSYIPLDDIERFLKSARWIQHYAYAYHDKDVKADGTPKEPHTHILLYTYDGKSSSAICKIFNRYAQSICANDAKPEQTLCEIMVDSVHMWRYLLHLDDPDKYQYEESRRICDDVGYWKSMERTECLTECTSNKALQIMQDLEDGISTMEMVRRYGREWVINRGKYLACHAAIHTETYGAVKSAVAFVDEYLMMRILQGINVKESDKRIFLSILSMIQNYTFREYGCDCDLRLTTEKERIQQ